MKKSHKNSIITVITDDDIMRFLGFALNDLDPDYKKPAYETKNDELMDKKRRIFYDNFVIIQVEVIDDERYLVEIVNEKHFDAADLLYFRQSKKSKK